jgi:DNA recombination protein Rad52
MGFSAKQVKALRRNLDHRYVRTREANGRELSYIEGWYAISEANRIFGFDGWSRETVDARCVLARENRGSFLAVYTARVRISVRAGGSTIIREGQGSGEGRAASPGEVHDTALKAAETDATKRALATFGKPFGLALYGVGKSPSIQPGMPLQPGLAETVQRFGFHPDDTTPIPRPSRTPGRIDKSQLAIAEPKRLRDKAHLEFVASQPYLICGRQPSDPHHLRFAQPRAMGLKVSDEFTVPLCRGHHRQLHQAGNEVTWWENVQIDALATAKDLWKQTHTKDGCVDAQNNG